MTNCILLGGERAATYAPGKDVKALGPSDSSDCGSDVQGERSLQGVGAHADQLGSLIVDTNSDSDASGTGERASATGRDSLDGADIAPDQIIGPDECLPSPDLFDLVADGNESDSSRRKP